MTELYDPGMHPPVGATADASGGGTVPAPQASGGARLVRRFVANRLAVMALVFIIALVIVAIFAPVFAPKDPDQQDLLNRFDPDSGLLGTDDFGRDQLSRLIFGARVSLGAALIAVVIATGVGVPFGILAGYKGRWVDTVSSRVSDALQSVPALIFALTVIAVLGPGLRNAMIAIGIVTIPRFFRVSRAATLDVAGETFIEATRALGCSPARVMWRHILPNALSPLIVQISLTLGAAVTAEASLSFLGLGVRLPTASWGSMLTTGASNANRAPYLVYPPGIVIALTVLAFTLVGDGLRDALGTRQITGSDS